MRWIRKGQQPGSFIEYKAKGVGISYEEMDKNVKDDLLITLIIEQKGICAYCQQLLNVKTATIEHHCERSICNGKNGMQDRRLDYSNLLAVCPGKAGKTLHCDTKKATFGIKNGLPMRISPLKKDHIFTISYSSTGLIKSANHNYNKELDAILNLNANFLKEMRKKKWLIIFKISRNNRQKMQKLIEKAIVQKDGKFIYSFPALAEYMSSKFCK